MEPLALLKKITLDNVMRAFFQGVSNINVQKDATRGFTMFHVFLGKGYNLVEKAKKIKIS